MKNLFEAGRGEEIKERLGRLRPDSPRQWGKMTAGQTVAHCAVSMEWAVGDRVPPKMFVGRLVGMMVKPLALGNDKPFKRNSPTEKSLLITDERDLAAERERLRGLIERFVAAGPAGCTKHAHSFFGKLTPDEWAILTYKHLDHHLRQFGV